MALTSNENDEKFKLHLVNELLSSALHEEDDVQIKPYLHSFEELNKFFTQMGTIFGFVSSDLMAKVEILAEFLAKEEVSHNFHTVKTMILYEKSNNLLKKNDYTSGSRTLLRLHRGLDFIREFLRQVGELRDSDNTSNACRQAYDKTLAKYHSFIIKQGARLAMYTLPNREHLLIKVCGEPEAVVRAMEILPETLETTALVYQRIEKMYEVHDLHSLP